MNESVVAVLLTQNRKKLLAQGLNGLFNQSLHIRKIFIIDSISSDGTYKMLKNKGIINRLDVEYVRLNENKGPSGGFAVGIKHALKENPNWIWILDDDICPENNCLENLLKFNNLSQCIAPFREKTVPFFNPAIGICSHSHSLSFNKERKYIFTNTCCFEGMLIHTDLIKKIGLPDERFFQVYGDTIYGFIASLHTNVVHVKEAVMKRLLPKKKPINNKRVYLLIRNLFLVREYLKKYNLLRPGFFLSSFILIIFYYLIIMPFKTLSIGMPFAVIKGLIHGLNGKFGLPK